MFRIHFTQIWPHDVTHRLIRNPNYGGQPSSVRGCCIIPIKERKIKPKFFEALKLSVVREGFRNPILLYSTPEGLLLSFGGSRLRVAKELDREVPAIIVDYTGEYGHCKVVKDDNYDAFFKDPPALFEFTDYGLDTHYSLERSRRIDYDPAGMRWTEGLTDTNFLTEEFPWL